MKDRALLIGGFHETIELAEECRVEILGILDPELTNAYRGIPILGTDEDAPRVLLAHAGIPLILSPDNPGVRLRLAKLYRSLGASFRQLISPRAVISPSSTIGDGVIIQAGVHISANVRLDSCVKVNTLANLMHDVVVSSYATIAPNAVLLGRVSVGEGTYVGAHATLLPGRTIGRNATVGAGAVVTHDVPDGTTVAGVPARPIS